MITADPDCDCLQEAEEVSSPQAANPPRGSPMVSQMPNSEDVDSMMAGVCQFAAASPIYPAPTLGSEVLSWEIEIGFLPVRGPFAWRRGGTNGIGY